MTLKLNVLRKESSNEPIEWNCNRFPHLLISAPTNSGKSYFIKYILSILTIHSDDASIMILDYKQGSDYWQWRDYDNVFLGDFVYDVSKKPIVSLKTAEPILIKSTLRSF